MLSSATSALLAQTSAEVDTWSRFFERNGISSAMVLMAGLFWLAWFRLVVVPDRQQKRELEAERAKQEKVLAANRDARDERQTKAFETVAETTQTLVPAIKEIRDEQREHVRICAAQGQTKPEGPRAVGLGHV